MFPNDPIMSRGITGFSVTAAIGLLAYVAAELAARWASARPRQLYVSRLICLALFFALLAIIYLSATAEAFTGPAIRYYRLGVGAKSTGVRYGTMTWVIWFIVALLERPKRLSHGKAEPAASSNGGPAALSGTSGVQEGPPSVS
jgi:hypothetical protein